MLVGCLWAMVWRRVRISALTTRYELEANGSHKVEHTINIWGYIVRRNARGHASTSC